mmetsp:Transcript_56194/g.154961  ORF Transcript_56194/g.154961 Transcript_56194/m.154961 type:complete len:87 (+) Transcript_56194:174-434(+)
MPSQAELSSRNARISCLELTPCSYGIAARGHKEGGQVSGSTRRIELNCIAGRNIKCYLEHLKYLPHSNLLQPNLKRTELTCSVRHL